MSSWSGRPLCSGRAGNSSSAPPGRLTAVSFVTVSVPLSEPLLDAVGCAAAGGSAQNRLRRLGRTDRGASPGSAAMTSSGIAATRRKVSSVAPASSAWTSSQRAALGLAAFDCDDLQQVPGTVERCAALHGRPVDESGRCVPPHSPSIRQIPDSPVGRSRIRGIR